MNQAIIVDLDGTLADINHRVHHVKKLRKDWKAFNAGIEKDLLNKWCYEVVVSMKTRGYEILFVTGRGEATRQQTITWMEKHKVPCDNLYMRAHGDRREDSNIKRDIYLKKIKENYDVVFVLDDRLSVVKMWRKEGLICLQCDWGDF